MKNNLTFAITLLMAALFFVSCDKDKDPVEEPPHDHEEELITTVSLQFTDPLGVQPAVQATFRDTDGPGGAAPSDWDTIYLAANTTYQCAITFLNESVSPAEDITEEILAEDHEHLICFTSSTGEVSVTRTDTDGNYEVGLQSLWTVQNTVTSAINVVLKHQPGVKNGSCDPGETDVEILFPLIVE